MRYGLAPSEIDHMPIDLLEEYFDSVTPDTVTFSDEAAYLRWMAQRKEQNHVH